MISKTTFSIVHLPGGNNGNHGILQNKKVQLKRETISPTQKINWPKLYIFVYGD